MLDPPVAKIKGGRWTVVKFAAVSVAYTIGWMTVSSMLGHYKLLYGPQILLQMNIAYFLPSIPLLVASSFLDERLDRRFGVARTVLARLLIGLGGCSLICAAFPFEKCGSRWLLGSVTALGLVAGLAFSASYQMVARFANKNTISLGLGCVGSGLVVLVLEVALQIGPQPTHLQMVLLFELTAGFVVLGCAAAISLLLRHWTAIEAGGGSAQRAALEQPLLQQQSQGSRAALLTPLPQHVRRTISHLISFAALQPYESVSEAEGFEEEGTNIGRLGPSRHASLLEKDVEAAHDAAAAFHRSHSEKGRPQTAGGGHKQGLDKRWPPYALDDEGNVQGESPLHLSTLQPPPSWSSASATLDPCTPDRPDVVGLPSTPFLASSQDTSRDNIGTAGVAAAVWPCMVALFLSGLVFVLVFPFFTFVPSSGLLGDSLPKARRIFKVLFFSRLFADLGGRMLPRLRPLAPRSQAAIMSLGLALFAAVPPFFVYLKAPPRFHSDVLAVGYVAALWCLAGLVNTSAYMHAPLCVPPGAKAAANGLLAIAYQGAHCFGLLLAVVIAAAMFGNISV